MKTRSVYPVLLALFAIGSVISQNADELPVQVETDNQFPPEHSELDGQNEGSETDHTNPVEVTTTAEATGYNTNEKQDNDESIVEVSTDTPTSVVGDARTTDLDQKTVGSTLTDVVAPALANDVSNIDEGETTAAEFTAAETAPLSETTAADIAAPAQANDDLIHNEDGEATAAETSATAETAPTSQSTTLDIAPIALANDDLKTNSEDGETTAPETTAAETTAVETTAAVTTLSESMIADVAAQTLANGVTNNEGGETTAGDVTAAETTAGDVTAAETTVADITVAETTAAETTLTTGSTKVDGIQPILLNVDVTNNEGSQTTVAETIPSETTAAETIPSETTAAETIPSETTAAVTTSTSGSTTADVAAPTLTSQDEQETTYEDNKTTVEEHSATTSGSTTVDLVAPTLATKDDDFTNIEASESTASVCPKPCVCITEGDSTNYIVDCTGNGLTEIPTQIDPKTTTLILRDNKLTTIPKSISELKNLKVLDANDNLITELESGSISELPELVSLELANNRFLEYPKDLENSVTWNKLKELDLAGNELKTTLEIFQNYKALRTVTLPEVSPVLVTELCTSLKDTLLTVCTQSCKEHSFKCPDLSVQVKDDSLEATLPGMIPINPEISMLDLDASVTPFNAWIEKTAPKTPSETKVTPDFMLVPDTSLKSRRIESSQVPPEGQHPETSPGSKDGLPVNDFSLRTAVNNAPQEKVALDNKVIDTPKEPSYNETDVKVGAKTIDTKGGGGVDKSVIAVIVAGMVIVIAVITIKKNWSSITNRFSSTPRPNERSGNANGTTPEEVPLQDKSPV